jgi:methionine-rich copper-binding protein CopC
MLRPLFTALALTALTATAAFAHAELKTSTPAAGATVAAPQHLMLTFSEKVRVTNLKLVSAGKDVPVTVDRAASSDTVHVPVPALAPGNYEVQWTVVGADGHPMNGKLAFTVAAGRS